MSTVATSEKASPAPVVLRPVVLHSEAQDPRGGNVIRLPVRDESLSRRRAEPGSAERVATPNPEIPAPETLDPETAERAVVGAMSCKIAQASLEVLSGVRSVQQLARWLDSMCMAALTTRARLHAEACRANVRRHSHEPGNVHTLHHQPMVRSVHCSAISPGIFETTVILADTTRVRAIAMRLELERGLWKVTALQIG